MADKIIKGLFTIQDLLGPKNYATITGTARAFPIASGGGGMLFNVVINKGFTGALAMVDQADNEDVSGIAAATATSATAVTIISGADITNPTYSRRLVITPGGTTNDVASCTIVVTGTDVNGSVVSENFAFAANAAAATNGDERFMTVTDITVPAQDGGSATFAVGSRTGESIATITNPATGDVYEYNIPLVEGLQTTHAAAGSVTYTYLGESLSPVSSISPSVSPPNSFSPSVSISVSPSASPSLSPSLSPSVSVSLSPSVSVSLSPSASPSISPSRSPSTSPSASISVSSSPSISPSFSPSASPSLSPSLSM